MPVPHLSFFPLNKAYQIVDPVDNNNTAPEQPRTFEDKAHEQGKYKNGEAILEKKRKACRG